MISDSGVKLLIYDKNRGDDLINKKWPSIPLCGLVNKNKSDSFNMLLFSIVTKLRR